MTLYDYASPTHRMQAVFDRGSVELPSVLDIAYVFLCEQLQANIQLPPQLVHLQEYGGQTNVDRRKLLLLVGAEAKPYRPVSSRACLIRAGFPPAASPR